MVVAFHDSIMKRTLIIVIVCLVVAAAGGYYYYRSSSNIAIRSVTLLSPDNQPIKEDLNIKLNKEACISVEYWKDGQSEKYRSAISKKGVDHLIHLLLLEPKTKYNYQIVIEGWLPIRSKEMSFHTREQSPWMVHDWIKQTNPHDATAIGSDMTLICYRGYPGYLAVVDGHGTIRWYWQDDKLGVRIASLTPRGTILALLAPANKDEFKQMQPGGKGKVLPQNYYMRSGRLGFMGGTELVEIDPTGKVLWRCKLQDKGIIMHHDVQMNDKQEIYGIVRDFRLDDRANSARDTLWGDAIACIDTLGNIRHKWSPWTAWDIKHDSRLDSFKHDRFHLNTISFDKDGNYITSSPIENQIWKINARTGKFMWKLGKKGNFKMDGADYFHFQHAPHINKDGDLLLFDNGDYAPQDTAKLMKRSRAIAFRLDTVNMVATREYAATLPAKQYTARMGAAYLLSNGNILQTSSKTGCILITDKQGKILWELNSYFIPYRAIVVPESFWSAYRTKKN